MVFTHVSGKQTLKANLLLYFSFGGAYIVILSNDLIQDKKCTKRYLKFN